MDTEQYQCTYFIAPDKRRSVIALRAFNATTAMLPETGAEAAQMKMMWWKDSIKQLFQGGKSGEHPVLRELQRAIQLHNLSISWFYRILDRRMSDLEGFPITTTQHLEQYAEDTASSLLYLTLETLGIRDLNAEHAASHIGKSIGIATLLRGTPIHISKRTLYIPNQLLAKHKVSMEEIFRGEFKESFYEAIYEMASVAVSNLAKGRKLGTKVPKESKVALMSGVVAEQYLNALQKKNFDVFHHSLIQPKSLLPLQLKLLRFKWSNK
eukprot:CAMPEP_0174273124 /NCGR_PEP_ID=MMETSP0439-20130205/53512_1 /TAXON_ID=0 /ORGANISM="Stereomyxa ramosa, Strain Chinc5" /LENGTH=266 /DNA_ID=CAMNT_0015364089 /DNA_START=71 /DNA_END=868 /DNA_ORIENTATION=-